MPQNKLSDLNNHLFLVLEKLQDGDMDLETAGKITDVAKNIIEIKKVEVQQANVLLKAGYTHTVANLIDKPKEDTND